MSASHTKKIAAALTPADRASRDRRIARAIRDGVSLADVGRRFGLDKKTVRAICVAMGVEIEKGGTGT